MFWYLERSKIDKIDYTYMFWLPILWVV